MLRISFVLPHDSRNTAPYRNQPLTPLYLLTILENEFRGKVDLSIIDLRGIPEENIKYYLPERNVYLHSATTPDFNNVVKAKDMLKEIYPSAIHVIGGTHIDLFPETHGFDSVAVGNGEENIVAIIKDILNGKNRKVYKDYSGINLDKYPFALRKYLAKPAVIGQGLLSGKYSHLCGTTTLFSRGCPFKCTFCANVTHGKTVYRSPELIKKEIEYLKNEYNIECLAMKDDNCIPINKKIAGPFLETIASFGVKWRGQCRANGISENMVKLASESGCVELGLGIESVSPKTLEVIDKKLDLEEAKIFIQTLHAYGIGARIHLIVGLPAEPDDIVESTIKFIEDSMPMSVLLSIFTPYPGSDISTNPEKYGMRITSNSFGDIKSLFGRFDEAEKPAICFEYMDNTPWGKGKSTERILNDYMELQSYLREKNLNS